MWYLAVAKHLTKLKTAYEVDRFVVLGGSHDAWLMASCCRCFCRIHALYMPHACLLYALYVYVYVDVYVDVDVYVVVNVHVDVDVYVDVDVDVDVEC